MPTEPSERFADNRFADNGFADNWAYLKMELRWLDQMLMLAVARQRKENHEIERVTHSKADRATSSWWKGILSTEGKAAYDEHRQPTTGSKTSYQQQLEGKIQFSYGQGVWLALPRLRDRLSLTVFEKNLVLMSLAPEINRRYARLYRYLQGDEAGSNTDLPTLDLVLRLLCRNDVEWRDARQRLVTGSPLIQQQLLQFLPHLSDNLLNCPLKLTESLVNYLLSEQPTQTDLDTLLLAPIATTRSPLLQQTATAVDWSDLVLPSSLLTALQALTQHIERQTQGQAAAAERWGIQLQASVTPQGTIALLTGASGTGKTAAAAAIAHSLNTSLDSLDLNLIDPKDYAQVLQHIAAKAPTVLLLKSAHLWFGRSSVLPAFALHQFLAQRQQAPVITLLSAPHPSKIQCPWRQMTQVLAFPMPKVDDRLKLWKMVFPPTVPLNEKIDWKALASLPLSGGEIQAIAQTTIFHAATTAAEQLEMAHLVHVLAQQGKFLEGRRQRAEGGKKEKKERGEGKRRRKAKG